MMRSSFIFAFCAFAFNVPRVGFGQVQDRLNQESVEKAESYAVDLVAAMNDLPARWAARQRREIVNTIDLGNSKYSVTRSEEVWASDDRGGLVYTRFSNGDSKTDGTAPREEGGVFDRDVLTRTSLNQTMHKIGTEPWTIVPKLPNIGSTSTHPYNWAFGGVNSARLGGMREPEYLNQKLFGQGRKCFVALSDKKGNLVSYWGVEDASKKPFLFQIVFSKEGRPIDYSLLRFPRTTSKESIAKREFTRLEQATVQWKKFPQVQRNGQPIFLPVRVEINSVLNKGQELECVNDIVWKFGRKEVPDSVFSDPAKSEIVEPDFDQ
jgi:hypothetical protein